MFVLRGELDGRDVLLMRATAVGLVVTDTPEAAMLFDRVDEKVEFEGYGTFVREVAPDGGAGA